jgi:predicted metal-dependent enzyme (double-stranded beta helix superfamily)
VLTVEDLVADCQALIHGPDAEHVVAGYLAQLLRDQPDDVRTLLGDELEPTVLHRADDLTIVKIVLPPRHEFYPHNHLMWAAIAGVVGREDNRFYTMDDERVVPTSGASYEAGQVGVLPETVIHSVQNASSGYTIGLHVYGGDLVGAPTTGWDPVTGLRQPPSAQGPRFQPHPAS